MLQRFLRGKKTNRKPRISAFEVVEIKNGNGLPSSIGVVKNISENGARITIFEADRLPARFEMWLPSAGLGASARIRWRWKNDIGVRFRKPINLDPMPRSCPPPEQPTIGMPKPAGSWISTLRRLELPAYARMRLLFGS